MSLRRTLFAALAVAALAPGTAAADGVRVVQREEPLGAVHSSLARPAPVEFTMVGIHWQGPGEVSFRTAAGEGGWSAWRSAQPEEEDGPDLTTSEGEASRGWEVGNPWWTGEASRIQYRVSGSVTRLRTFFVWSPVTGTDVEEASGFRAAETAVAAEPDRPAIIGRPGWGADESIVRGSPSYADELHLSVVHHTAGTNSYSRAQSAAIVRGIQRYHVLSNGWNDIGYNFLVDKYGRIFEGRVGGMAQNVIGAHAQGFNTGSVGVAVLGTYGSTGISVAARSALQRLLAWRLDVGHVDPRSLLNFRSFGNPRFPAGRTVRLRAISGHRDTGYTSCPGTALYGRLGAIAQTVAGIGLPKLYDPEVDGAVGGPVRFTARLSAARAWSVQVRNPGGDVVAQRNGNGAAVDWTWDASAVPVTAYTYTIAAGAAVRPATGRVPGPLPLAVTGLEASPNAVTPNGDWSGEQTAISFRVSRQATLSVRVVEASSGTLVRTLLASGARPGGAFSLVWKGGDGTGAFVPDGRYRIEVSADAGVEHVDRSVAVVVDKTLGGVSATPTALSPNGDGARERLRIGFELTRQAAVRVQIRRKGKVVRTVLSGTVAAGAYAATWDGKRADGKPVGQGPASAVVLATTSLGQRVLSRPIRLDTVRPVVRILSLRRDGALVRLRFSLSEAGQVRIWYGRNHWNDGHSIVRRRAAGTHPLSRRVNARFVRIVATDTALNRSPAALARVR
ncbi:MAG TPA: FlgD immunoglobulin-like domain containing protein [Gaiellaceae bacterium]|nr:FlgD immunoglobulin-like domain containing protein [Gaiellaceae bacterium]